MTKTLAPLVVLAALFAAAPALAQDGKDATTIEAKFEPAKNGKGEVLHARGLAKKLPDQTRLMLKLLVKGMKDPIGYWEVTVQQGAYDVVISLEGRVAAPLVYRCEMWLMLQKQIAPIRRQIQRDLGVGEEHNEVLDASEIVIGTDDERKAFTLETLKIFEDVLKRARSEFPTIEAALQTPPEPKAWAKQRGEINARLRALQDLYNERGKKYVSIGESSLLAQASTLVSETANAVKYADKGPDLARGSLETAHQVADKLREDLDVRLSGKTPAPEGVSSPPAKAGGGPEPQPPAPGGGDAPKNKER